MKQKTKFKKTEIGMIPEDWEETKIGIKCKIKNGKTNSQDAKEEGKYPLFDRSSLIKRSNKFLFDCEAIIIPGEGKDFIPRYFKGKFDLHQRAYAIWTEDKEINIKFIYYWILQNRKYLSNVAVGSTVRSLRLNHLESFPLAFPRSLSEQSAIAHILSTLDEKIELLQKQNKTLEEIGQAIFKKWFIDNPEKGEWEVGKLGDIGSFKNGINYLRNEKGDTEFSIINVRDISNKKWILNNSLDKIKINYNKAKDYLLREGDIIIARSACPGKVSLVLGDDKDIIYSGFSIRYRLNDLKNYFYISLVLENLQKELTNFSIGTTLTSVNQEVLKNIKINIPDKKTLKDFNKVAKPIFKKISNNCFNTQTLSQIRDSLLPKLMSGKIRVPVKLKIC